MTECAGHLRNREKLSLAVQEAERMLKEVSEQGYKSDFPHQALITCHLVLAHYVYLKSILFQVENAVGSRGSGAVTDENGNFMKEDISFREKVLETVFENGKVTSAFVPRRPLPETDGWFENIWKDYREGKIYTNGAV